MRPQPLLARRLVHVPSVKPVPRVRKDGSIYDCLQTHDANGRPVLLYEDNIQIALRCFQCEKNDALSLLSVKPKRRGRGVSWRVIGCVTLTEDSEAICRTPPRRESDDVLYSTQDILLSRRPQTVLIHTPEGDVHEEPVMMCEDSHGEQFILRREAVEICLHGFNAEYDDIIRVFCYRFDTHGQPLWTPVHRLT